MAEDRSRMKRREFIKTATVGSIGIGLSGSLAQQAISFADAVEDGGNEIPRRPLGKTGEMTSMIGVGGWHIGRFEEEKAAMDVIARALDLGVNFFDSAWDYYDGRSEERLGKALSGKRDKIFLMTKHHGRDRKTAMRHLEDSLRRLNTDHLDLWQFHAMESPEDVERIFDEKDGAIAIAEQAKREGKARFIGVTGHRDPYAHLRALELYDGWDTVQMPLNAVDRHYLSFEKLVLPKLVEKGIGVLAMKTLSMGRLLEHNVVSVEEGLRYVWSLPVSVLISGFNAPEHVDMNVSIAKAFTPMTDAEKGELLERTQIHKGREVEYYKKEA